MFICQRCSKTTSSGESMNRLVVESRKKVYRDGSIGHEIVKEISVCQSCAASDEQTQES